MMTFIQTQVKFLYEVLTSQGPSWLDVGRVGVLHGCGIVKLDSCNDYVHIYTFNNTAVCPFE